MLGCGALRLGFRVWGFMNIEFGGFGVHDPGLERPAKICGKLEGMHCQKPAPPKRSKYVYSE